MEWATVLKENNLRKGLFNIMKKNKNTTKKNKRTKIGIKWRMFAIILAFIFLFTVAIWVFQIQMLNYFYQGVKYKEFDTTVEMVKNAKDENLKALTEIVSSRAKKTSDDIWLYKVDSSTVNNDKPWLFSDASRDSHAVFLQRQFDDLYLEAKENSIVYIGVFHINYYGADGYYEFEIIEDNKEKPDRIPYIVRNDLDVNALRLDVIPMSSGSELLIVQRANLVPMSALANTIRTQVVFTSVTLIIFSIVMVILMSGFITTPIIRINESAKNLGKGNYDIEFNGGNYKEINELSDTLNYAAVELSKNDKLQKELISNISHDLRTPLTMIRGYSELMRDIPGETTAENFQIIIDETTRLTELVNGMLDLSKLQSGVRVPDKQLFCLTEIIKTTLIRYEKLVTQESYKIEFIFDDEVFVCADRSMILQVLYNFINNAVNYTGEDKYVCVKQSVIDDKIRISIIDTGVGISDEQLPYIWDRYYKVDKVHRRATVGTGLGLSIVKSVLEAHGSTYGVISEEGKGSTFYFELDKVDPETYIG